MAQGSYWQNNWRYCQKCHGLFYDGYPQKGTCPAGGGHVAAGYNFVLYHSVPVNQNRQKDWEYCVKCQGLFFNGYPQKGTCPAGGEHQYHPGALHFVLDYNLPETPTAQANWRYCQKCHGLFYDGYPQKGTCPGGGEHVAAGYNFVLAHPQYVEPRCCFW
jgi:cytochrome c5